ncbi:MAG: protease modulator HflC [Granulosicoccaceae bacterium]|jgi:membrane protease subunit HflC
MFNSRIFIILAALGVFILSQSLFMVDERELAIKFKLGEIVRSDFEPGLHFKTPFVNNVRFFDKRLQTMDASPARIITTEKKYVLVDSFVKWRIGDVEKFYRTMRGGDTSVANATLQPIVNKRLRDAFGERTIQAVVSGEREEVMDLLTENIRSQSEQYGIKIIDVRVKRVDFEEEISESVFRQMRTERQRVAKEFRARGRAEAERIRAETDRKYTTMLAEAYRDAENIRGAGDAKSAEIYASAYNKNREFYSLYRSLNAYKSAFANKNDVILLEPEADFFKYFKSPKGK